MTSAFASMIDLWTWPFQAAKLAGDTAETMLGAQRVIAQRLPTIADAARNPFTADYAELTGMVTEKVAAFSQSGRAASSAIGAAQRATAANLAAAGKLARGQPMWPTDWMKLATDTLTATAALATMPAAALAPVHRQVTKNDRRLGRKA